MSETPVRPVATKPVPVVKTTSTTSSNATTKVTNASKSVTSSVTTETASKGLATKTALYARPKSVIGTTTVKPVTASTAKSASTSSSGTQSASTAVKKPIIATRPLARSGTSVSTTLKPLSSGSVPAKTTARPASTIGITTTPTSTVKKPAAKPVTALAGTSAVKPVGKPILKQDSTNPPKVADRLSLTPKGDAGILFSSKKAVLSRPTSSPQPIKVPATQPKPTVASNSAVGKTSINKPPVSATATKTLPLPRKASNTNVQTATSSPGDKSRPRAVTSTQPVKTPKPASDVSNALASVPDTPFVVQELKIPEEQHQEEVQHNAESLEELTPQEFQVPPNEHLPDNFQEQETDHDNAMQVTESTEQEDKELDNFKLLMKNFEDTTTPKVDYASMLNDLNSYETGDNGFSLNMEGVSFEGFDELSSESLGLSLGLSVTDIDLPQIYISRVVRDFAIRADANIKGLKKDKMKKVYQMEDQNVCLCPFEDNLDMCFFAVFDGHVGKNAAIAAKEIFPQEFSRLINEAPKPLTDATDIFKVAFKIVDEKMENHEYEGATATCVFIWKENGRRFLQAANVGDSSAFISRGSGAVSLTVDHKPSHPIEQERLRTAGVEIYEGTTRLNGLAISRSLGDHYAKKNGSGIISEPHISDCIELQPTDTLLVLASDGLWDAISGKHALDIIKNDKSAEDMAKKLLDTALVSKKCKDNVTVLVVNL